MIVAIDCEYNGFGGGLISMALVAANGSEFYEVVEHQHMDLDPWVVNNVLPVLDKEPVSDFEFNHKLENFLNQWESPVVVADWHEDIKLLCNAIVIAPGIRMNVPDLTFMVKDFEAPSKIPHNALEDARANMEVLYAEEHR